CQGPHGDGGRAGGRARRRRRDYRRRDRARRGAARLSHGGGGQGRLRERYVVPFVPLDPRRTPLSRAIRVPPGARGIARAAGSAQRSAASRPPAAVRVAIVPWRSGTGVATARRPVAVRPARRLSQRGAPSLAGAQGDASARAWADELRRLEDPEAEPVLRLTKGAHVAVPRQRMGHVRAMTLTSPLDGRVMFVLPWGDLSYIGTTDTDDETPPDDVRATGEDVI